MTTEKQSVMGLFRTEEEVLSAMEDLKTEGWPIERVHSPIPSGRIIRAMGKKKSKVGWFTLAGGITGFISGFLLAAFTATRWNLIVSGKPIVSLIPFFIVGFEFTILFAVFGNVVGLLTQADLPHYRSKSHYDPLCSGSFFGVLAGCDAEDQQKLEDFFRTRGAKLSPQPETQKPG